MAIEQSDWLLSIDWRDPSYLASGSADQRALFTSIMSDGILQLLSDYSPTLVSTHCIGLNTEQSDLDIICTYPDGVGSKASFIDDLNNKFAGRKNFSCTSRVNSSVVVARCSGNAQEYELYADCLPVKHQNAYRHLTVMASLLAIANEHLRLDVMKLRKQGLKGEASFCKCLMLPGDPYQALLELEPLTRSQIEIIIEKPGRGIYSAIA
jgi:hypothetical protein